MSFHNSEKILIHTRTDFLWQNGLEYAQQGVSIASRNGINLHYLLEGDGPEMESLAFTRHDLGMQHICTLKRQKSSSIFHYHADIFLIPAVKQGNFSPPPWENYLSVIVTSIIAIPSDHHFTLGTVRIPAWDAEAVARAIRDICERKATLAE